MLSSFFRGLTPNFLVTGFFLFNPAQPDFGSVIGCNHRVDDALCGRRKTLHIFGSLIGMGLIGGFLIASHSYRVKFWLFSILGRSVKFWIQIIQSYIALGTGGWFGKVWGESSETFLSSDAHTDFIFAVIGEELGFLWVCAGWHFFLVHLERILDFLERSGSIREIPCVRINHHSQPANHHQPFCC